MRERSLAVLVDPDIFSNRVTFSRANSTVTGGVPKIVQVRGSPSCSSVWLSALNTDELSPAGGRSLAVLVEVDIFSSRVTFSSASSADAGVSFIMNR